MTGPGGAGRSTDPRMRSEARALDEAERRAEAGSAPWLPLVLVSAAALLLELAVIRWLSAEVRLFSYFKNLPLLAAFLGLAVGFGFVGRRDWRPFFAPLLAVFVAAVLIVGRSDPQFLTYPGSADEFLFFTAPATYWLAVARFLAVVVAFFLVTTFLFVPLGQATGIEMTRHAPLGAYVANVAASLAGVWAFAVLSYLETPPAVWFGVGLLAVGAYLGGARVLSRSAVALFLIVLVAVAIAGRGIVWSPYQRVEIQDLLIPDASGRKVHAGYTLSVQHVFFMHAYDLSPEYAARMNNRVLEDISRSYSTPYRARPNAARVLVVGAGMGNDAAAALRGGAAHVDAVEIDPSILDLGRRLHPEHPYTDPRVTTVADDARAFLTRSRDRYDVVAFGFLDSHTLLSGLSSVRLDSFVYTRESFVAVRDHLTPDGLVAVSFSQSPPWLLERLGRILADVMGADRVYVHRGVMGTTFVAGPVSAADASRAQLVAWTADPAADALPLTTDDWPYLYLRRKVMPIVYWEILLLLALICPVLIGRSFPGALRPQWDFWFLGAAFLLVEFKSITEMALLFGTTWLVNALAISGVLVMVLAANAVAMRGPRLALGALYAALFGSLALSGLFPLASLNALSPALRGVAGMILLSLPLFFAGLVFAESLGRAGETSRPLASNLSGAVAGGVLEYGSLWWGIKSLYVIAALLYAGAFLASRRARR